MVTLQNTPEVRLGVVGVSRDCFPVELTKRRLEALMKALKARGVQAVASSVVIESESDALAALTDLIGQEANALVIFLGNFGPEGPTTILAEQFPGPVMVCAAAEEDVSVLAQDRGDALCGMLNCSYSLNLRRLRAYIPQKPVGLPEELAERIDHFRGIARVILGVRNLKVFGFGPRPQDFFACNAPIQPLYDLGVEVMENSELDLFHQYEDVAGKTKEIEAVANDMKKELGDAATYPDLLPKLAQFEVALLDWMEKHLGSCEYAVFADKCWPAFERQFKFVPCYVNSRLATRGIPVSCEVDLYGAFSEYIAQLATLQPATLLDINNSVPAGVIPGGTDLKGASMEDLFMGFHCGNTPSCCMKNCTMKFQVIMHRLMEGVDNPPDITRGTLEGQLRPGPATLFRLQSTPDCQLRSYVAEGEILDVDPQTFGGTGVFAIPGFQRFYRHILIGWAFPHHGAIAFAKAGKTLWEAVHYMGVGEIGIPLPERALYEDENPFEGFLEG